MKIVKSLLLISLFSIVIASCCKEETIAPTTVEKGTVATLSDLKVQGKTVEEFGSSVFDYTVVVGKKPKSTLPPGPPPAPIIVDYTLTDSLSSAEQTNYTDIPGTTTIKVTSEDGQNSNIYSVNLIYE